MNQLPHECLEDLRHKGYSVLKGFICPILCQQLRQELLTHRHNHNLAPAAIGRDQSRQIQANIRRDKILWLERSSEAQVQFLELMHNYLTQFNRQLLLGLRRYEAHFACYEPGDFYGAHKDSFQGRKNRILSSVVFLNESWQTEDMGCLQLLQEDKMTPVEDIPPLQGTVAFFLSEDVWHRVQETRRTRLSIAGWFRADDSLI